MVSKSAASVVSKPSPSERTVPVAPINHTVLAALERLTVLPDGWDHAGAERINPQTIRAAQEFVRWLPDAQEPAPQVVPMTRGRLQLEWHQGGRSLEIEFESPDQVHYLKWDKRDGTAVEDVLPINERERIRELIRWFQAGVADGSANGA